ncbi:MAG: putative DNA methylase [Microgenomates group bacterium GW2011_GWA1_48_10]|nr:MAG: putative DNA methylase [Microgenomates group bacterium GW2011_GWA1_48_10]
MTANSLPAYLFVFGNSPDLAQAELAAVLNRLSSPGKIASFSPPSLVLQADSPLSSQLFELLGGTVKIGEIFDRLPKTDPDELQKNIVQKLILAAKEKQKDKISFGISQIGETPPVNLLSLTKAVKKTLEAAGYKVRFVLPTRGERELTSVVITKEGLDEIILSQSGKEVLLTKTVWVQNFESWNKRDYDRPKVAPHTGMIPPKLARMMVNLALPATSFKPPAVVLDPFCGVGTILAEAMQLGADVIGTDIDPKQVQRTKENLAWLKDQYSLSTKFSAHQSDATQISRKIKQKLTAIVTEPDLGPNDLQIRRYSPESRQTLMEKLTNLYLSGLKDWHHLLPKSGRVGIVLPSFTISKDKELSLVKMVIDKAKIMGYSLSAGPFKYARPQATVRRNICVFESEKR